MFPKLKSTQYQTQWSSNSTRHYLKLCVENCSSLVVGANDAKSSYIQISAKFHFSFAKANKKLSSNRVKVAKFLDETIARYLKQEKESKSLSSNRKAFAIF